MSKIHSEEQIRGPTFHCIYCGQEVSHLDVTFDHLIPKAKHGNNTKHNKRMCCFGCNQEKDDMTVSEYYAFVAMKLVKERDIRKMNSLVVKLMSIQMVSDYVSANYDKLIKSNFVDSRQYKHIDYY